MNTYIFFPDKDWWKKNRTEKELKNLFIKVKIKNNKI